MGVVNCTNCTCNNEDGEEINGTIEKKRRQLSFNMRTQSFE